MSENYYRNIPSINSILNNIEMKKYTDKYKPEIIKTVIKKVLTELRNNNNNFDKADIIKSIIKELSFITESTLKPVINATGILLHTNIGRAPLGNNIFEEMQSLSAGYSNLEFDLKTQKRQNRNYHISKLLKYLTGAEDALVVNNNAAAIMLLLHTFAKNKEVIISRGELIEIGESFRIHEIMEAAGSKLREVGTTNKTRPKDYQNGINNSTALIVKAHKSNYTINGFTEEVSIKELSTLSTSCKIPFIYDLGSGLLTKPDFIKEDIYEPYATEAIKEGADIVTFSGDKLLGGPQCGIIIGKKELIEKIKVNPMLRALRVGKTTYSALSYTLRQHLLQTNKSNLFINKKLYQSQNTLMQKAELFRKILSAVKIENKIVKSKAQTGGGTLPETFIPSFAVEINTEKIKTQEVYSALLTADIPVLALLRKGKLMFDIFTLNKTEFKTITENLVNILS